MLTEAFPRLAVRLRAIFPDAIINLEDSASRLAVGFANFPRWRVEVSSVPLNSQFQILESAIYLRYDCLQNISQEDLTRLIAGENLGLRGATLTLDPQRGDRTIKIRSSFIAQKGRTVDEAENLAIDTLSLLRFARLFDDRINQCSGCSDFSYESYYSQYLSKSLGRSRYINYARGIFVGSMERVFGQVATMLKDEYKYKVSINRAFVATLTQPNDESEIILRIPEEIPILTCSTNLYRTTWPVDKVFELATRLNQKVSFGHFEVNVDGSLISYVSWKHLTNDLRFYSLDKMILSVNEARLILFNEVPAWLPEKRTQAEKDYFKERASSLDSYHPASSGRQAA